MACSLQQGLWSLSPSRSRACLSSSSSHWNLHPQLFFSCNCFVYLLCGGEASDEGFTLAAERWKSARPQHSLSNDELILIYQRDGCKMLQDLLGGLPRWKDQAWFPQRKITLLCLATGLSQSEGGSASDWLSMGTSFATSSVSQTSCTSVVGSEECEGPCASRSLATLSHSNGSWPSS